MTDHPRTGELAREGPAASQDTTLVLVCYALMLAAVINGITAVIAVVIAYVNRGGVAPWLQTHYRFLIYSFWLVFVLFLAFMVLWVGGVMTTMLNMPMQGHGSGGFFPGGFMLVALGSVLLGCVAMIWWIVRLVIGLTHLQQRRPHPRPTTLLW